MNDKNNATNGWNEWSKHVLKELERLNNNDEHIKDVLTDIKGELYKINTFDQDIKELKQWKERVEDVASVSSLKDMKKEINSLKTFKTISTTVWVVAEVLLGLLIAFKDKIF